MTCRLGFRERKISSPAKIPRTRYARVTGSPVPWEPEKRPFSNGLFSIQSEGLACNLTAGEYVIAEGVWHHAQRVFLLRIDYIHHSVMIAYKALP